VRAQTLTNRGLAVRPELGKALVFWHMLPDGQPDSNVWSTKFNWAMDGGSSPTAPHSHRALGEGHGATAFTFSF
jgi:hypothetical protein